MNRCQEKDVLNGVSKDIQCEQETNMNECFFPFVLNFIVFLLQDAYLMTDFLEMSKAKLNSDTLKPFHGDEDVVTWLKKVRQ